MAASVCGLMRAPAAARVAAACPCFHEGAELGADVPRVQGRVEAVNDVSSKICRLRLQQPLRGLVQGPMLHEVLDQLRVAVPIPPLRPPTAAIAAMVRLPRRRPTTFAAVGLGSLAAASICEPASDERSQLRVRVSGLGRRIEPGDHLVKHVGRQALEQCLRPLVQAPLPDEPCEVAAGAIVGCHSCPRQPGEARERHGGT
mmetsp:Transcript_103321/g.262385  ORF Transcript_103321/g.262385 Transcript_103321/m.262385 type:complete len:201 (+) Transcript_103321:850-1452(+)